MTLTSARPAKFLAILVSGAALSACGGNAGEGTGYDEQLACYTTLMGVNAANRGTSEELKGATNALLKLKALEMEGGDKAQQVKEDVHASSYKIQEIIALKDTPEGEAELATLQAEAEACEEKFKS
ncbi:MAG: hypothetical protein ABJ242_02395 [Marinomonas sp.]